MARRICSADARLSSPGDDDNADNVDDEEEEDASDPTRSPIADNSSGDAMPAVA
jgi:hypothetical protein